MLVEKVQKPELRSPPPSFSPPALLWRVAGAIVAGKRRSAQVQRKGNGIAAQGR